MESIGDRIDRLHELREQKRSKEDEIKDLNSQMADLENIIMLEMQNQSVEKLTSPKATVYLNRSVKPQIEDWDAFLDYVSESRQFQLLERRVSSSGFKEMLEHGRPVPGLVPFTLVKLGIRSTQGK